MAADPCVVKAALTSACTFRLSSLRRLYVSMSSLSSNSPDCSSAVRRRVAFEKKTLLEVFTWMRLCFLLGVCRFSQGVRAALRVFGGDGPTPPEDLLPHSSAARAFINVERSQKKSVATHSAHKKRSREYTTDPYQYRCVEAATPPPGSFSKTIPSA